MCRDAWCCVQGGGGYVDCSCAEGGCVVVGVQVGDETVLCVCVDRALVLGEQSQVEAVGRQWPHTRECEEDLSI